MKVNTDGVQDIMSCDGNTEAEYESKPTQIQDILKAHDGTHGDCER